MIKLKKKKKNTIHSNTDALYMVLKINYVNAWLLVGESPCMHGILTTIHVHQTLVLVQACG